MSEKIVQQTHTLGFPRIGEERKLKWATEKFWRGEISEAELLQTGKEIREENWKKQREAGITKIPSNDFSFYDQVLDTTALVGAIPRRYNFNPEKKSGKAVDLETYFLCARGKLSADNRLEQHDCKSCGHSHTATTALEMTKWFDTNYHYLVPEFTKDQEFSLSSSKIFDEYQEAKNLGIETVPVLLGPISYLFLGKEKSGKNDIEVGNIKSGNFERISLLPKLVKVYEEILSKLAKNGVEWVQIDEPVLSLDLPEEYVSEFSETYKTLKKASQNSQHETKILLANYFGELEEKAEKILSLPVDGFHIDAVRGKNDIENVLNFVDTEKVLSVGVVNGRNIWKNDYAISQKILEKVNAKFSEKNPENIKNIWISSSCSLVHSPISLSPEKELDREIKSWLSFAEEKLVEISELSEISANGETKKYGENQKIISSYKNSTRVHNKNVKKSVSEITPEFFTRGIEFSERIKLQRKNLNLPAFPTTTIGSDPQTNDIREAHRKGRNGAEFSEELKEFCRGKIKETIKLQEDLDLDVLVHGESERNDMVEYFGRLLDGFAFSEFGWVQSFGSRYVKPPIIFGDVSLPAPMTVEWSKYAQSCTKKPVKGMLTGPITILQWSFVREDIPRSQTTWQIALALREEVKALEKAGIKVIQIDEPALREGLPLREKNWAQYLDWAVKAFQITASVVKPETQIHTHMCYCEFEDVIQEIANLDADVISIENSRSDEALIKTFGDFKYPNEIGLGVWDIHSPRVPSEEEIEKNLRKALTVLKPEQIWVNPDCGLKTRGWVETVDSLRNLVSVAKKLRSEV